MERLPLKSKVLSENQIVAESLRERFRSHGVLCLNLISGPGSGKTTLLERTLASFDPATRVCVLTGDIQTDNDARRLAQYGFPVQQITTGGTCHLDARMIEKHLAAWDLDGIDLLFIENVGNLVCPSSYDLGEASKIVLLSVTEGDDKPLKYPSIFFKSGTFSSSPRSTCCPTCPSMRRLSRPMRGWCIPASRSCAHPRRPREGWMHGSPG